MKKIAVLLTIFVVTCGASVIAEDEVKVPFSAIKSSCYGEIDMSRAEFPLSEVGEECVSKDWLEENKPEEESRDQEETGEEFRKVVSQLSTPEKLVSYMEEHFTHYLRDPDVESYQFKPYSPQVFFRRQVGTCGNFAIFASYVLDQHDYNVELLYYRGISGKGEALPHTVTIFRGQDNKLYYITNVGRGPHETGFQIYGPFDDKDQIINSEKKRYSQPDVEVYLTSTIVPGTIGEELKPPTFAQAKQVLDTPLKIGNYVARNFEFQKKQNTYQKPSELFKTERGNWYDFAIFLSYFLDRNDYGAQLLKLDFTVEGEKWRGDKPIGENDLLVIYHDKDDQLRHINQQAQNSLRISQPFDSLKALLEHEEKQRTLFPSTEGEIRIPRYALLEPGRTDLKPSEWILRKQ